MTITIRELAAELDTSERTVQTWVDDLIAVDGEAAVIERREDLTNSSGRLVGVEVHLADDAAQAVRDALAAQDETGWDEVHLAAIADAVQEVAKAEDAVGEAAQRRDDLIRRAKAADVKVDRIAEAAQLKVARLYQIFRGPGVR